MELSSGNLDANLEITSHKDDLDGAMQGLVMLKEELKSRFIAEEEARKKLDQAIATMVQFGKRNYGARLEISDDNSLFDGLASGINMLGEYLAEAKQELEKSNEKFGNIFQYANDAIFISDPKTKKFIDANDQAVALVGYAIEELRQLSLMDLRPEDAQQQASKHVKDVRQKGQAIFETILLRKDGKVLQVEISARIIRYGGSEVILSFVRDISQRKQRELELSESRKNYQELYHKTPAMMHSINAEGKIISVSSYWLEKMGYSEEEVIGKRSTDFLTEESRKYAKEVVLPDFFKAGSCKNIPYQFVKKNGEVMDVLLSATSERDAEGKIARSLAIITDVTLEKKAETALKQSEAKNRALLRANPDVIFRIAKDGHIIDFHADPEMLILHPETFKNANIRDVLSGDQTDEFFLLLEKAIETGEVQIFHHDMVHKDRRYYFEGRIAKNGENEVLKIVRNITAEKEREQALKESQERNAAMIHAIPDLLFRLSSDGVFLDHNTVEKSRLYMPAEQFMGRKVEDVLPPSVSDKLKTAINHALETGDVSEFDYELDMPRGKMHYEARVTGCGRNQVMGIVRDITEQRRVIDELRENQLKLQSFFELAPVGIALNNMQGEFLEVNTEFSRFTGYTVDELNQLSYWDLTPRDYEDQEQIQLKSLSETGKYGPYEKEYIHKKGHRYPVLLNGAIVKDGNGEGFIWSVVQDITERKKAEEDQAAFVNVFETSLNEIYIFDAQSLLFNYVNKGARDNLGYNMEELFCLTPVDLKDEFDKKTFNELIEPLRKGKTPRLHFETTHKRKNGTYYPVEVHLQYTHFKGTQAFVAIILDITDRREAEKEIKEYANFFSMSMELMCIADMEGYFRKLNPRFVSTLGYSEKELLTTKFYDFVHPEDVEATKNEVIKLSNGIPIVSFTNRYECKDGGYKWLIWSATPNVKTGLIYATARDITELKEAENSLLESEENFRSLAENAPNFIARINRNHEVDFINRVDPGYTMEDVIGAPVYAFVNPEEHEIVGARITEVFASGVPSHYNSSMMHKNGREAFFTTNLGPVKDDAGEVTSIIMIIQDITEQVRAGEEIKRSYNELQLIDKVNRASFENRSFNQLAVLTLNALNELEAAKGGRFYLYNDDEQKLNLIEQSLDNNLVRELEKKTGINIRTVVPPVHSGTSFHQAISTREIIVARDPKSVRKLLAEHTDHKLLKSLAEWAVKAINIKTFMIIPLASEDNIFGLITLTFNRVLQDTSIERFKRFTNGITAALLQANTKKELLHQKQFTDDVLNNIPADIAVLDGSQKYLFANKKGTGSDEMRKWLIGKTDFDYCRYKGVDNTWAKERGKHFKIALSEKNDATWIDSFWKNGKEEHLLRKFHPVTENGKLKYMIGYGVDITDRIKAERESKKLASIVSYSNDAIVTFSLNGEILSWNAGAERLFGYEAKEVVGKNIGIIVPEDKQEECHSLMTSVSQGSSKASFDTERLHKDNGVLDVSLATFPLFDALGRVTSASAIMRDITDRKEAERALVRSESSLKEAQRIAHLGSWQWDVQTDKVTWSDEEYNLYSVPKDGSPLSYKTFLSALHPDDKEWVDKKVRKTFETKKPFSFVNRTIDKNERIKYIESRGKVEFDNKGQVARLVGTSLDVTKRVEAEKMKEEFTHQLEEKVRERTSELQISQNELKYQVDTLNHVALVSITDTDGNITYANDVFCKTSGYTQEELIGQNHRILKSGKQPQGLFRGMWKSISKGKIWSGEIINKSKNGGLYWVHTTIVPFFNLHGEIEKYVAVRFNITEEKHLQEQLKQSLEKEKELGQLKSRFVSTASHQFRTPMAIIQSNSELLKMITQNSDESLKAKLEKATGRINKEVKRMTDLMDEVLILGKISSGKMEINKKPTDLLALCNDLCYQFNAIQQDGRRMNVGTSGTPGKISIDAKLIDHAISNLISNAFKYSSEHDPELHIAYEKNSIKIIVSDQGMGIPKSEIPNLFQPFYRAENAKSMEGTGLGLAIVKEYVELNDGEVLVESRLKRGTTFTIILPNRDRNRNEQVKKLLHYSK